jgi:hypothetical protein
MMSTERVSHILGRLRRFMQIGNRRRALLIEAVLWLLLARLGLAFIPFPRLASHLGRLVSPQKARTLQSNVEILRDHIDLAGEIGWAVTRAARHAPFRAVCLPQAMAGRIMLRRRGVESVMHFGARMGEDKPIDAHAWLDAAGVQVTGYPVADDFAEIACFV